MTTPCLYSIVRYSPYPETEEFANVGVVICAPKEGYFDFHITKRNDSRVRSFFHDNSIFPAAKDAFHCELVFAKSKAIEVSGAQNLANFFNYFTAKKESIFHFSPVRVVLTENPQKELKRIYNQYINHSDYTKTRREEILAKALKLSIERLDGMKNVFKSQKINGDLAKFSMPLVAKNNNTITRAIKPLAFENTDPGKMMEHGDAWVMRIKRATEEHLLSPKNVLFTIEEPDDASSSQMKVIMSIKKSMAAIGVNHLPADDMKSALDFAGERII